MGRDGCVYWEPESELIGLVIIMSERKVTWLGQKQACVDHPSVCSLIIRPRCCTLSCNCFEVILCFI